MTSLSWLPPLNAALNGTSAVLLVTGLTLIKQGRRDAHKRCMVTALIVSSIFLVGYITYHAVMGTTHFKGTGWIRAVYFTILGTHTVLAVTVPPLAITSLVTGLRERFDRHRWIAKFTFPIWLYVSVTGVVVYLMLRSSYPTN